MNKTWLVLAAASLVMAPLVFAHNNPGAGHVPGTPDPTCEVGADRNDHDYGPPASGLFLYGFQDSNLEDCDGDFNPTDPFCAGESLAGEDVDGDTLVCEAFDYDLHSEYALGGAWLLVNSGDGDTSGSIACFGETGHHPTFGPISVHDLFLGSTVRFTVATDHLNLFGPDPLTGLDCGDFQTDKSAQCVGTCTVTFPPGLGGEYEVIPLCGSQGHVSSPSSPMHAGVAAPTLVGPCPPLPSDLCDDLAFSGTEDRCRHCLGNPEGPGCVGIDPEDPLDGGELPSEFGTPIREITIARTAGMTTISNTLEPWGWTCSDISPAGTPSMTCVPGQGQPTCWSARVTATASAGARVRGVIRCSDTRETLTTGDVIGPDTKSSPITNLGPATRVTCTAAALWNGLPPAGDYEVQCKF